VDFLIGVTAIHFTPFQWRIEQYSTLQIMVKEMCLNFIYFYILYLSLFL